MVDNPLPTIALVLTYLAVVVVIGPFYMRDRKPFKLKNTLIYYNAFQVLLSGYMFYEVRITIYFFIFIIGDIDGGWRVIGHRYRRWWITGPRIDLLNPNDRPPDDCWPQTTTCLLPSNYGGCCVHSFVTAPNVRMVEQVQPQVPIDWLQRKWSCAKGEFSGANCSVALCCTVRSPKEVDSVLQCRWWRLRWWWTSLINDRIDSCVIITIIVVLHGMEGDVKHNNCNQQSKWFY